jgi:hypothetical protein
MHARLAWTVAVRQLQILACEQQGVCRPGEVAAEPRDIRFGA